MVNPLHNLLKECFLMIKRLVLNDTKDGFRLTIALLKKASNKTKEKTKCVRKQSVLCEQQVEVL